VKVKADTKNLKTVKADTKKQLKNKIQKQLQIQIPNPTRRKS